MVGQAARQAVGQDKKQMALNPIAPLHYSTMRRWASWAEMTTEGYQKYLEEKGWVKIGTSSAAVFHPPSQ
jgi:hypothetical protein